MKIFEILHTFLFKLSLKAMFLWLHCNHHPTCPVHAFMVVFTSSSIKMIENHGDTITSCHFLVLHKFQKILFTAQKLNYWLWRWVFFKRWTPELHTNTVRVKTERMYVCLCVCWGEVLGDGCTLRCSPIPPQMFSCSSFDVDVLGALPGWRRRNAWSLWSCLFLAVLKFVFVHSESSLSSQTLQKSCLTSTLHT